MSRIIKDAHPKMVGVWGKDERYINRDDLLIQGKNTADVIRKVLKMTKGSGFIDVFEITRDHENITDFKRIYVEEELFLLPIVI